jgi:hypothetical protein
LVLTSPAALRQGRLVVRSAVLDEPRTRKIT